MDGQLVMWEIKGIILGVRSLKRQQELEYCGLSNVECLQPVGRQSALLHYSHCVFVVDSFVCFPHIANLLRAVSINVVFIL